QEYNIKVIPGFWVPNEGFWSCGVNGPVYTRNTNFSDPNLRADILNRFALFINDFKDHPAILFWAIGNENNLTFGDDPQNIRAFYSLVDEMAELAHQIEGEDYHPVAFVNGDLGHLGNATFGSSDADMPNLDIWGANVYRGRSFGTLFTEYRNLSSKPFWISEFGIDAWNVTNQSNPDEGFEDQAAQADYAGALWDEITANNDTVVGGTIMEYSDEWWKPYEWLCDENSDLCNRTQNHFGFGATKNCPDDGGFNWVPPSPDRMFNEEWWGVVKLSVNPTQYGPDIVTPREVYYTLQSKFTPENAPPTIDPISDKGAFENQVVTANVRAVDAEGGSLILSAELLNGDPLNVVGATFTDNGNGTGVFRWTVQSTSQYPSRVPFVIKARDADGELGVEQFDVNIRILADLITPTESSILNSSSVLFQWTPGENVTTYNLQIGTAPGASDIVNQYNGTKTSFQVNNIPQDGSPIYVRLWSGISLFSMKYRDYVIQTEGGLVLEPAEMITPTNGTLFDLPIRGFFWTEGVNVQSYTLAVGSAPGADDIFKQTLTENLASVNEKQLDGRSIYVRLTS
ncbi:MAG: hypothetical protein KC618_07310, partial [Candidatus Omnitrophica bacterium]|nr:hypothetical protein [Candidatus Omnitrophota bacterium]